MLTKEQMLSFLKEAQKLQAGALAVPDRSVHIDATNSVNIYFTVYVYDGSILLSSYSFSDLDDMVILEAKMSNLKTMCNGKKSY